MKTTKPKLTTGIQSRMAKSKPSETRYMYVAITVNPSVQPTIEMINSNFRPSVSTNDVELNVPAACNAPNTIADMYGSMPLFDSWNITTLYEIRVKQPQY